MIRRLLDALYLASGFLAALFMVAIAMSVLFQICGRFVNIAFDATEVAGFFLAASTFFGLAYTFHSGTNIRIDLVIGWFTGRTRRMIELLCCGIAVITLAFLSYHSALLTWQMYRFGDVSRGLYAIPFWIPQISMTLGIIALTIAVFDDCVRILLGRKPSYQTVSDAV